MNDHNTATTAAASIVCYTNNDDSDETLLLDKKSIEVAFQVKKKQIFEYVKEYYKNVSIDTCSQNEELSEVMTTLSSFFKDLKASYNYYYNLCEGTRTAIGNMKVHWTDGPTHRFGPSFSGLSKLRNESSIEWSTLTITMDDYYVLGPPQTSSISLQSIGILYRIVPALLSVAAIFSTNMKSLTIWGFGCKFESYDVGKRSPDVEDVFTAFGKEKLSSWRTKSLTDLEVYNSNMNARGDSFHLEEDEYPTELRTVYTRWSNHDSVIGSATIYRVASRSPKLNSLCTGTNSKSAVKLTPGAVDALCNILSRKIPLYDVRELPSCEFSLMSEDCFGKLVKAVTRNHRVYSYIPIPAENNNRSDSGSSTDIYKERNTTIDFHLKVNKCLDILQDESQPIGGIAPLVLSVSKKQLVRTNQLCTIKQTS